MAITPSSDIKEKTKVEEHPKSEKWEIVSDKVNLIKIPKEPDFVIVVKPDEKWTEVHREEKRKKV